MITVIQRVSFAKISVAGEICAAIDTGILALLGIEKTDTNEQADKLIDRILNYRIFADDNDNMNLSLIDKSASLLLVPQFTLVADTKKGNRPSFSCAASPQQAEPLFDYVVTTAKAKYANIAAGIFGADMHIELCNIGPVTFILEKS